jgi:hypothetical protein
MRFRELREKRHWLRFWARAITTLNSDGPSSMQVLAGSRLPTNAFPRNPAASRSSDSSERQIENPRRRERA